ncbi:MAG TPA: hypothetical protein VFZ89_18555 [Solirubrobacteraceae bacterium]
MSMLAMNTPGPQMTVRSATDEDRDQVRTLAGLDSARPLSGPVLLGELDGACVAALSLNDGRVVADPFVRTTGVAALLRTRASQLTVRRFPTGLRRARLRFV